MDPGTVQEAAVLSVCQEPGFLSVGKDGSPWGGGQGVCSQEEGGNGGGGEDEEGGRGLLCCPHKREGEMEGHLGQGWV